MTYGSSCRKVVVCWSTLGKLPSGLLKLLQPIQSVNINHMTFIFLSLFKNWYMNFKTKKSTMNLFLRSTTLNSNLYLEVIWILHFNMFICFGGIAWALELRLICYWQREVWRGFVRNATYDHVSLPYLFSAFPTSIVCSSSFVLKRDYMNFQRYSISVTTGFISWGFNFRIIL